jgi:hypothetical protein
MPPTLPLVSDQTDHDRRGHVLVTRDQERRCDGEGDQHDDQTERQGEAEAEAEDDDEELRSAQPQRCEGAPLGMDHRPGDCADDHAADEQPDDLREQADALQQKHVRHQARDRRLRGLTLRSGLCLLGDLGDHAD